MALTPGSFEVGVRRLRLVGRVGVAAVLGGLGHSGLDLSSLVPLIKLETKSKQELNKQELLVKILRLQ